MTSLRGRLPSPSLRLLQTGSEALTQVLRGQTPTTVSLEAYWRTHPQSGQTQRKLVHETIFAFLRRRLWFEALAKNISTELGLSRLETAFLLSGLTCTIWDSNTQAICRENPLLASLLEQPLLLSFPTATEGALHHNWPAWLEQAFLQHTSLPCQEFPVLAEALLKRAPVDLRMNLLRGTHRPTLQAQFKQAGISCDLTPYSPWGLRLNPPSHAHFHWDKPLPASLRGYYEIQDEGSQLIALLTQARRGQVVVDFCAGAGGKTLALGAAMRGIGHLYAWDRSAHRLANLKERLPHSGLSHIRTAAMSGDDDVRLSQMAAKADRVLVDAPCSGTGTLRRDPGLKWRLQASQIDDYAKQQRQILRQAACLPKPGGRLIYATCSLLHQENDAVVKDFLMHNPGYQLQMAEALLQQSGLSPETAAFLCEGPFLRLWPHRHGTDGFFVAVLERSHQSPRMVG
jgi:16S rRNA (cytosine967-C5)-methyltransferase